MLRKRCSKQHTDLYLAFMSRNLKCSFLSTIPVQHHPQGRVIAESFGRVTYHCCVDVSAVQAKCSPRGGQFHSTHYEHNHSTATSTTQVRNTFCTAFYSAKALVLVVNEHTMASRLFIKADNFFQSMSLD